MSPGLSWGLISKDGTLGASGRSESRVGTQRCCLLAACRWAGAREPQPPRVQSGGKDSAPAPRSTDAVLCLRALNAGLVQRKLAVACSCGYR